jgi:hypothetical protein
MQQGWKMSCSVGSPIGAPEDRLPEFDVGLHPRLGIDEPGSQQ